MSDDNMDQERGQIDDLRRRVLQASAVGTVGYPFLVEKGKAAEEEKSLPEGADGDNSIAIDNDIYDLDIGETESGTWIWFFNGTTTLFHEFFALQDGDGTVVPSYNPVSIVDVFPDTGAPGEPETAVIDYEVGGIPVRVERTVELDPDDPVFTITYDITNQGSQAIDELRLYEHCDYDIGGQAGFTDDRGAYEADPELVYVTDVGQGLDVYAGFTGEFDSENHHVGEFPASDEVLAGTLNNQDAFPTTGSEDPVVVLQWNLGELAAGNSTSFTVRFGAASSLAELRSLVTDQPFEKQLANRFAPTLHFGEHEKWFPTDPRKFLEDENVPSDACENDGDNIVCGFNALNKYTRLLNGSGGAPPFPTVFYDFTVAGEDGIDFTVAEDDPIEDKPLIVVSYWFYYVFNQFLNSHMHDWSVLHVYLDNRGDSPKPVLLVGRAHGPGKAILGVENNEYFKPKREDVDSEIGQPTGVLEEVGAHASVTDINDRRTTFEPIGENIDITNGPDIMNSLPDGEGDPYGLPRDEGATIPYIMPRVGNTELYQHEDLPDVDRSDLIEELTLRSPTGSEIFGFCGVFPEPPSDPDLPVRTHGRTVVNAESDLSGDHEYDLARLQDLESQIDEFTGEKLDIDVCISFLDDIFLSKDFEPPDLQTSDYDPFLDISEPAHRDQFAALFDFLTLENSGISIVEGEAFETKPGSEGEIKEDFTDIKDELADLIEFSLFPVSIESMIILESEDIVLPTANGRFSIQAVPGEHRLIINGPGYAPYAEKFDLSDTGHQAGGAGRVSLVPNSDSVKIGGELSGAEGGIQQIQIANDYVGELYDSRPPVEKNAFAVYVPESGTYTVEITDNDGKKGAFRIDPEPGEDEVVVDIRTGKASLASYLAAFLIDIAETSRSVVENKGLAEGLADKFNAASASASRATDYARKGRDKQANNQLRTARNQINAAMNQIKAQRGKELSEAAATLISDLAKQADAKAEEAIESPL